MAATIQHEVDYLIIGQGICGTLLSYYLKKAGKSVLVVDELRPDTASQVASGIMNPVTGKKWVTTWMAETLFPFAHNAYLELGALLGVPLIESYDLFSYHATPDAQQLFEARITEDDTWLYTMHNEPPWAPYFNFHYGIGAVHPCYVVAMQVLLQQWRHRLKQDKEWLAATFKWQDCRVAPEGVTWQQVRAGKLICCDGAAGIDNPYFTRLPFQLNKGEAVIVAVPGLPRTHIYKHGILNMVPWQDDQFWIGSIFDREYKDKLPTASFRKQVTDMLDSWLKLPYELRDHRAALRPATGGQKPFTGIHPLHPAIGIFNGMGSKGCSQAPYLAHEFVQHLIHGHPLTPEADISRFRRILSL